MAKDWIEDFGKRLKDRQAKEQDEQHKTSMAHNFGPREFGKLASHLRVDGESLGAIVGRRVTFFIEPNNKGFRLRTESGFPQLEIVGTVEGSRLTVTTVIKKGLDVAPEHLPEKLVKMVFHDSDAFFFECEGEQYEEHEHLCQPLLAEAFDRIAP